MLRNLRDCAALNAHSSTTATAAATTATTTATTAATAATTQQQQEDGMAPGPCDHQQGSACVVDNMVVCKLDWMDSVRFLDAQSAHHQQTQPQPQAEVRQGTRQPQQQPQQLQPQPQQGSHGLPEDAAQGPAGGGGGPAQQAGCSSCEGVSGPHTRACTHNRQPPGDHQRYQRIIGSDVSGAWVCGN